MPQSIIDKLNQLRAATDANTARTIAKALLQLVLGLIPGFPNFGFDIESADLATIQAWGETLTDPNIAWPSGG